MEDRKFLIWILSRLYLVHGERSDVDYMSKLASIIDEYPADKITPNTAGAVRVRELVTNGK